jgi:hypothetical protein
MKLTRSSPHLIKPLVCCSAVLLACSAAAAAPAVYAGLGPEKQAALPGIRQAFGDRVAITPVGERQAFVPAQVTSQRVHPYIREVGRVTLAAVADVDGRLRDPVIVESTNPRLNRMMQNSMKGWRCIPARLSGAPVPSVVTKTVEVKRRQPVKIF